jgi:hypothetical protein
MTREYVEEREGGYYVLGSRVSLDSEVFGNLAFYLAHREIIDAYLEAAPRETLLPRPAPGI